MTYIQRTLALYVNTACAKTTGSLSAARIWTSTEPIAHRWRGCRAGSAPMPPYCCAASHDSDIFNRALRILKKIKGPLRNARSRLGIQPHCGRLHERERLGCKPREMATLTILARRNFGNLDWEPLL